MLSLVYRSRTIKCAARKYILSSILKTSLEFVYPLSLSHTITQWSRFVRPYCTLHKLLISHRQSHELIVLQIPRAALRPRESSVLAAYWTRLVCVEFCDIPMDGSEICKRIPVEVIKFVKFYFGTNIKSICSASRNFLLKPCTTRL